MCQYQTGTRAVCTSAEKLQEVQTAREPGQYSPKNKLIKSSKLHTTTFIKNERTKFCSPFQKVLVGGWSELHAGRPPAPVGATSGSARSWWGLLVATALAQKPAKNKDFLNEQKLTFNQEKCSFSETKVLLTSLQSPAGQMVRAGRWRAPPRLQRPRTGPHGRVGGFQSQQLQRRNLQNKDVFQTSERVRFSPIFIPKK